MQALAWRSIPVLAEAGLPVIDRRRWMSALPDGVGVSEITIPGTHDSATRAAPRMACCQDMTLLEQLYAGIRFLDIRCNVVGDALRLYHGPIALDLAFESDVCDACLGFLSLNPGETVIMLVSNESGTETRHFEALIRRVIERHPAGWYLENSVPALRRARGRIVLIRRFPVDAATGPFGLDGTAWADNRSFRISNHVVLDIQDQYIVPSVGDIARKWTAIRALLDKGSEKPPGVWMLNYCSGTSGRRPAVGSGAPNLVEPYPDQVARGADGVVGENQRLLAYVRELTPSHTLGTIVLDYAGDPVSTQLIDALLRLNFQSD